MEETEKAIREHNEKQRLMPSWGSLLLIAAFVAVIVLAYFAH